MTVGMSEANRFRALLRSNEFAAGMFSFIPAEAIVDIAGYAGFKYLIFDTEHASYDIHWIERQVRACEAAGIASVVRVSHPDPYLIARILDTGADALMFARVASAKAAEDIVGLVALPPAGNRGACPGSRAGQYFLMPQDEYTRRSNATAIVLMIETKEALDDVDAIVRVPGLDALAVGPVDLSYSLGVHREHPKVAEAQQHVSRVAKAAGLHMMASAKTLDAMIELYRRPDGPRVFWYATEAYQIGNAFRNLIDRSMELIRES